ncbi:unnamed protein product [Cyclocybe aegerita]|uniref:Uncharacterized protein n=1 Tax=Cyclocybe aegerita TaxID=1973307 RepID=A0A8S0WLE0_CYCAE|nr:unnamed protein product [Cyclocybe aegerita]
MGRRKKSVKRSMARTKKVLAHLSQVSPLLVNELPSSTPMQTFRQQCSAHSGKIGKAAVRQFQAVGGRILHPIAARSLPGMQDVDYRFDDFEEMDMKVAFEPLHRRPRLDFTTRRGWYLDASLTQKSSGRRSISTSLKAREGRNCSVARPQAKLIRLSPEIEFGEFSCCSHFHPFFDGSSAT